MNYELAKQLKDAGFPQLGNGDALWLHIPLLESEETVERMAWCQYVFIAPKVKEEVMYVPTLSELIEACGFEFEELSASRFNLSCFKSIWLATGIEQEPWNPKSNASGKGSTPEEAVANLWLALNKKLA